MQRGQPVCHFPLRPLPWRASSPATVPTSTCPSLTSPAQRQRPSPPMRRFGIPGRSGGHCALRASLTSTSSTAGNSPRAGWCLTTSTPSTVMGASTSSPSADSPGRTRRSAARRAGRRPRRRRSRRDPGRAVSRGRRRSGRARPCSQRRQRIQVDCLDGGRVRHRRGARVIGAGQQGVQQQGGSHGDCPLKSRGSARPSTRTG
jgi:hypothetical protein